MQKNQAKESTEIAQEIFRQLRASTVNGMPFLAYTGLRPQIFSATELYLKAPSNPGHVANVLVSYQYESDTYTVIFNGSERVPDVYADGLADLIVSKMGVK